MAKTPLDRAEDEARRRYADYLASAGVDSARFALEILYLLPSEFTRMYRELFEKALDDKPTSPGPMGKDQGRTKKKARHEGVGAREIQPRSKGMRSVAKHWVVRDEVALEEKRKVDRRIVRAVESALETVRERRRVMGAAEKSGQVVPDTGVRSEPEGLRRDDTVGADGASEGHGEVSGGRARQCERCGRWQGPSWIRCPFHGD